MNLGRRAVSSPRLLSRVQGAGGPRRGGASVSSAAGGRGGQPDAGSEQRGGGGGPRLRWLLLGLRAKMRRCVRGATRRGRKRATRLED
jgi:hypothetical protein